MIRIRSSAIFSAVVALVGTTAHAQRRVQPSVFAGLSSSTFERSGVSVDRRTGFIFGVALDVPVGRTVSFETGAAYVQKGASFAGAPAGSAAVDIAYVQIPALVRFTLGSTASRVYLEGGAAAAYRASCMLRVTLGSSSFSSRCEDLNDGFGFVPVITGTTDPVKKTDASALAGAGVDFGRFRAGARYDQGLTNIDATGDARLKNSSVLVFAAYRFSR
jgi:hypothetical protein